MTTVEKRVGKWGENVEEIGGYMYTQEFAKKKLGHSLISIDTVRRRRMEFLSSSKIQQNPTGDANVSKVRKILVMENDVTYYTIRDIAKAVGISLLWVHVILKRTSY